MQTHLRILIVLVAACLLLTPATEAQRRGKRGGGRPAAKAQVNPMAALMKGKAQQTAPNQAAIKVAQELTKAKEDGQRVLSAQQLAAESRVRQLAVKRYLAALKKGEQMEKRAAQKAQRAAQQAARRARQQQQRSNRQLNGGGGGNRRF